MLPDEEDVGISGWVIPRMRRVIPARMFTAKEMQRRTGTASLTDKISRTHRTLMRICNAGEMIAKRRGM